jgi:hypothetical protein
MQREANIPLFLWIATAVVAHGIWGGGANHASRLIGETLEIREFAASVRKHAQGKARPIEIALLDDSDEPEEDEPDPEAEPEQPEEQAEPEVDDASKEDDPTDKSTKPDPKAKDEPNKPEEKKEEPKPEEKKKEDEEKKKNELVIQDLPPPDRQKRIAVQQHVEDKNQADNPDAKFIADEANKVKEESQASITSTDQNDAKPTPGSSLGGPPDQPGNGELDKVAQSEDREGDPNKAPQETAQRAESAKPAESRGPAEPRPAAVAGVERRQDGAEKGSAKSERVSPLPGQAGQRAQQASRAEEAVPESLSSEGGGYSMPAKREASIQQSARRAKKKRELPKQRNGNPGDMLGLGAPGTTPGGINLNLAPRSAVAAIGEDKLFRERQADGQRRRSAHRGSWKTGGIERWRSAIENYVPSVRAGNQTALNSARAPFASYINMVHNRLHPIFADGFLASLTQLPGSHPMNDPNLVTHIEIVLDQDEGRIKRMGVVKTSGVTAFDISALESMDRAQPFGAAPREIVSPDGNVYFHWEFYRLPQYACSTYYAFPYILKTAPQPAPGTPGPPAPGKPPENLEAPPGGERHGFEYDGEHHPDHEHDHEHEG